MNYWWSSIINCQKFWARNKTIFPFIPCEIILRRKQSMKVKTKINIQRTKTFWMQQFVSLAAPPSFSGESFCCRHSHTHVRSFVHFFNPFVGAFVSRERRMKSIIAYLWLCRRPVNNTDLMHETRCVQQQFTRHKECQRRLGTFCRCYMAWIMPTE